LKCLYRYENETKTCNIKQDAKKKAGKCNMFTST